MDANDCDSVVELPRPAFIVVFEIIDIISDVVFFIPLNSSTLNLTGDILLRTAVLSLFLLMKLPFGCIDFGEDEAILDDCLAPMDMMLPDGDTIVDVIFRTVGFLNSSTLNLALFLDRGVVVLLCNVLPPPLLPLIVPFNCFDVGESEVRPDNRFFEVTGN